MSRLHEELLILGQETEWPRTPDVFAALPDRLERAPEPRPRVGRRAAAVIAVAVLGAGAAVSPVRSAVFDVLGIEGRERVVRVPAPPDRSLPRLDLGRPTTLADAQRRLAFRIRLPRGQGPLREVRYSDAIAGGAVSLRYRDFVLTEVQGGTEPVMEKRVHGDSAVRVAEVEGARAYFIEGEHEVVVLDREGRPVRGRLALVGANVLLWQRDGVAFRLETRAGLARTLAVARQVGR